MMRFDVSRIVEGKYFFIEGISYAGKPRSNTAMFVTKKVEHLLKALDLVSECLVFVEKGCNIPEELAKSHAFKISDSPQLEYARFAGLFHEERLNEERCLKYKLTPEGYYLSEDATIGENSYIEPGCIIGHDVRIGANARILAGSVIRHATIGDNFMSNEYAIIGAQGFAMAEDEDGNKISIPTLGRVIIGNSVEIGAHDNISGGLGGDTVIEDFVKIDALVYIGHDAYLHRNVEITSGVVIGGFDVLGEKAYVGINAVLRNRIKIGDCAVIGMGSTVTKSIDAGVTVVGNPAKLFF